MVRTELEKVVRELRENFCRSGTGASFKIRLAPALTLVVYLWRKRLKIQFAFFQAGRTGQ